MSALRALFEAFYPYTFRVYFFVGRRFDLGLGRLIRSFWSPGACSSRLPLFRKLTYLMLGSSDMKASDSTRESTECFELPTSELLTLT